MDRITKWMVSWPFETVILRRDVVVVLKSQIRLVAAKGYRGIRFLVSFCDEASALLRTGIRVMRLRLSFLLVVLE
jgi:hypothetical protein